MLSKLVIFVVLYICYYIFSGINEPFYLISGLVASFLGLYVAVKMKVIRTIGLKLSVLGYWIWLLKEIIVSTAIVVKHCWAPKYKCEPSFFDVETKQSHEVGYTLFGNSITLTPGTVCVYIDDDTNIVTAHALTKNTRKSLETGEMDEKVFEVVRDK